MRRVYKCGVEMAMAVASSMIFACNADTKVSGTSCTPGAVVSCMCPDGRTLTTACSASGTGFEPCACFPNAAGQAGGQALGTSGATGSAGKIALGNGGAGPVVGAAGRGGVGGTTGPALAGSSGGAGMSAGAGGRSGIGGMSGGGAGGAGTGGAAGSSDIDMLRQACVDTINMYRATLTGLNPLKRANAAQEACSDTGATYDGTNNAAHGYAKMPANTTCRGTTGLGAEDSCPGWGVGPRTGNATLADALKGCLMSMWSEGPPPAGTTLAQCKMDQAQGGCFLTHGHYINMSDSGSGTVACSFFQMANGNWWMNQDFAR